jgi:cation:H+ antiporter
MNYFLLVVGLLILVKGADILVEGASRIAKILKVPAFIVGLFIVALGTSAPETAIGITTGIQDTNLLTLGTVIGSNIANIALIMGITAMAMPLTIDSLVAKREMPILIGVNVIFIIMLLTGNTLTRFEAIILLLGMFVFLGYVVSKTKDILRDEEPDTEFEEDIYEYIEDQKVLSKIKGRGRKKDLPKAIVMLIVGLVALIGGANLAVDNAVIIAKVLGLSQEFIGISIIAFGTSLPELVTCLMAVYKKEDDIAVGNIIGSNILNILLVIGVSGLIRPIIIDLVIMYDVLVMFVLTVILMIPIFFKGRLSRQWGSFLLAFYIIFLAFKISFLS